MADYFTQVSFAFSATPIEANKIAAVLEMDGSTLDEVEYPDILKSVWPSAAAMFAVLSDTPVDDWLQLGVEDTSYEDGDFWISGSSPNLEAIAVMLQAILQLDQPVVMEWANTCTKLRLDAFGGGVAVIFKDEIVWRNTSTIADEIINARKAA